MPAYHAHIHAFQDDLTERASLDRINRAKEHWRAYVQGRAELALLLNKQAIEQDILLSKWLPWSHEDEETILAREAHLGFSGPAESACFRSS